MPGRVVAAATSSRWTSLGGSLAFLRGPGSPSVPRVLVAMILRPAPTRPFTATRRARSAAGPWIGSRPRCARAAMTRIGGPL
eukprot:3460741-Alexandrium_andersonii.AAC.1